MVNIFTVDATHENIAHRMYYYVKRKLPNLQYSADKQARI